MVAVGTVSGRGRVAPQRWQNRRSGGLWLAQLVQM
jgi:hypothetical protein